MEAKHTPGPWHSNKDFNVFAEPNGTRLAGCRVCSVNNYYSDTLGESTTNAKLIAAAPDLLAALMLFCCAVPSGDYFAKADPDGIGPNVGKSCDDAKEKARQAIAKAKGH